MHAISEIDVGVARRTEHDLGARGPAAASRMRRQVVRPEVSLDLDEPAPQPAAVDLADEHLPQQVARHHSRVPFEE